MSLPRTQTLFAMLVALLLVASLSGVAFGASKQQESRSNRPAESTTETTEDTDDNDAATANNVVDGGDNAHASGNDRSVEAGASGNQGNTPADPDDDGNGPDRTNGGVDQPGQPGGRDLADQDGNNGCGNDDDFEDDNEGRCGPATRVPVDQPTDVPTDEPTDTPTDEPTDEPTNTPTDEPTGQPTGLPTAVTPDVPSDTPTDLPLLSPAAPAAVTDTPGIPVAPAGVVPNGVPSTPVEAAGETPQPLASPSAPPVADATLAATGLQSVLLLALAAMALIMGFVLMRSTRRLSPVRVKATYRR